MSDNAGASLSGVRITARHLESGLKLSVKSDGEGRYTDHNRDNMFNPTFGLGIWTLGNLSDFLRNRPQRFLGLTPDGDLDRYWRFTLLGFYAQDTWKIAPRLNINLGIRYEFTTEPQELGGRDAVLLNIEDTQPTLGRPYSNPTLKNFSPRVGFAWSTTSLHRWYLALSKTTVNGTPNPSAAGWVSISQTSIEVM